MDSIQITGEDASRIVLALVADKLHGQTEIQLTALKTLWADAGLRVDDLIQALTLLAREQQLSMEGEGDDAHVFLAESTSRELPPPGQGVATLSAALQQTLTLAAERVEKDASDQQSPGTERRDGFS